MAIGAVLLTMVLVLLAAILPTLEEMVLDEQTRAKRKAINEAIWADMEARKAKEEAKKAAARARQTPEAKPERQESYSRVVMSPAALFMEFADNEFAAEQKFRNKQVTLRGTIYKIESSFRGYPEVVFNISHGLEMVRCQLKKKYIDEVVQLGKGQMVTITGTVRGLSLGFQVRLDDCELGE